MTRRCLPGFALFLATICWRRGTPSCRPPRPAPACLMPGWTFLAGIIVPFCPRGPTVRRRQPRMPHSPPSGSRTPGPAGSCPCPWALPRWLGLHAPGSGGRRARPGGALPVRGERVCDRPVAQPPPPARHALTLFWCARAAPTQPAACAAAPTTSNLWHPAQRRNPGRRRPGRFQR
jgi:hypothetical protein